MEETDCFHTEMGQKLSSHKSFSPSGFQTSQCVMAPQITPERKEEAQNGFQLLLSLEMDCGKKEALASIQSISHRMLLLLLIT